MQPLSSGKPPVDPDALLRELEESIPQGQTLSTRYEDSSDDDPFAELDAMVDSAMQSTEVERQYKADLKARKRGFQGLTKEEVAFCNSRMAAFEAARIWQPVRNIAVFTRFRCLNCGDQAQMFSRWMQEQHGRWVKTNKRWTPVAERDKALPTVSAYEDRPGALCVHCASIVGIETIGLVKLEELMK